ncbi:helix-turn-helix domain-containing protein [Streptomyces californicus]|uniref:helix-turn-helix domain-containing protein n=1 Tax=Streptomyces TaxID=1883 RepID=UPI00381CB704
MSMTEPSVQGIKRGPRDPQKRRPRLTAAERAVLSANVVRAYVEDELTIRAVAQKYGVSYGLVRLLLLDAEVTLRTRRGTRPAAAKKAGRR